MMQRQTFKKILIFGHSNIGDICYDMAVVGPLKKAFPNASINFVTSPKGADIGKTINAIDKVIVFDKHGKYRGLSGYISFITMIRAQKFDLAIILRDIQMHYFFGVSKVIKFKKNSILMPDSHLAEKYLKFLEKQGIKAEKAEFDFKFSESDSQYAKNILNENKTSNNALKIGIMPLAAWPLKCWPLKYWNKIIEQLTVQLDAKVFLFGKTGDSDWDKQISQNISRKAISLIDRTTVSQSMALIKSLDMFIGPDTSLLHFASCMGIETIGLYGATDPNFIYPLFHKQNIVLSKAKLECMPCYPGPHGGNCNAHEPAECMSAISCEQVWEKITNILKEQKDKFCSNDEA